MDDLRARNGSRIGVGRMVEAVEDGIDLASELSVVKARDRWEMASSNLLVVVLRVAWSAMAGWTN